MVTIDAEPASAASGSDRSATSAPPAARPSTAARPAPATAGAPAAPGAAGGGAAAGGGPRRGQGRRAGVPCGGVDADAQGAPGRERRPTAVAVPAGEHAVQLGAVGGGGGDRPDGVLAPGQRCDP